MANEDSEAGKYYNNVTIKYIKSQIMAYVDHKEFDIKESLKNFLIEISKEILEKQLESEDVIIEDNKIRIKNKKFQLKNNLSKEFETPRYRRYKIISVNGENLFVIEVEIPGEVKDIKQTLDNKKGNNIINIKGEKKGLNKDKFNPFEFNIEIPLDVVQLDKFLKCEKENGIYKLYYSIITNESDSDTVILENEEEEDEEDDENDNNDDDDDDDNNNNNDDDDSDSDRDRDKETNENETKATESKNNDDDDSDDSN